MFNEVKIKCYQTDRFREMKVGGRSEAETQEKIVSRGDVII